MPIDYEDEEEKRRRRAGVGIDIDLTVRPREKQEHQAAEQNERASSEPIEIEDVQTGARISADLATAEGREAVAAIFNEIAARKLAAEHLEQPFAEREGRPFQLSEQQPGRYDALREVSAEPQPHWRDVDVDLFWQLRDLQQAYVEGHGRGAPRYATAAEIEANPLAAVVFDIPPDATEGELLRIATAAQELREEMENRAVAAPVVELRSEYAGYAEQAERRQQIVETRLEAAEPLTREAIARDPLNAVARDLPDDPEPELLFLAASTAREVHLSFSDRAGEVLSVEDLAVAEYRQAAIWDRLADQAREREQEAETLIQGLSADTPLSKEAIQFDPWAAVYRPIPPDADAELLDQAYWVAQYCADAVADQVGSTYKAFEPHLLGADASREENYERAARRIDELDDLIVRLERSREPAEAREATVIEADDRSTIEPAEAIDDDLRRHRDDPGARGEMPREDHFSSDRSDGLHQAGEETSAPRYDRDTGEEISEEQTQTQENSGGLSHSMGW